VRSHWPVIDTAAHAFTRTPRWLLILPTVLAVGWLGWYLIDDYQKVRQQRIADAKAWTITGPPCPTITEAQFLRPHQKGLRRFEFQGAVFFRRYGHVACAAIRNDGGRGGRLHAVCQFTSPDDLMVRTEAGEVYFRPGPGSPATISTAGGAPRCVLASKYRLRP
jgi:hypothetical protein